MPVDLRLYGSKDGFRGLRKISQVSSRELVQSVVSLRPKFGELALSKIIIKISPGKRWRIISVSLGVSMVDGQIMNPRIGVSGR